MLSVMQVIRNRRSQKSFKSVPVKEDDIHTLLDAAVLAPNHKLTQPWGFVVLGRLARREYARIKAQVRVSQEADPALAAQKRATIEAETAAVPAVIAVTQKLKGDELRQREDYAAVFMAIENMLLMATSMDLGSKMLTGDVLHAPAMRALIKAEEDEEIVAIIHLGEPAEEMKPKARVPATDKTRYVP